MHHFLFFFFGLNHRLWALIRVPTIYVPPPHTHTHTHTYTHLEPRFVKGKSGVCRGIHVYIIHYFSYFSTYIICGCLLKPPQRGSSNEHPQCMLEAKTKKISQIIN